MKHENTRLWRREAFWVATGLGVSVFSLLAGTRLLTTFLSTAEYGRFALSLSLATLAVQVGATPVSLTVTRFYASWREEGRLQILLSHMGIYLNSSLALVLIVAVALAFLSKWIIGLPGTNIILLTGGFSALLMLNRVALGLDDAARERRRRALLQSLFEVSRFSLAIVFIWILNIKAAEVALGGFIIAAIMVVSSHIFILYVKLKNEWLAGNNIKTAYNSQPAVILSRFLIPLYFSNACIWIVMMTERWALQYYGSVADVGGYAAIYQLAFMPMMLLSNFLLLLSTPIIYQIVGANNNTANTAQTLKINRYLALVIIGCTLAGFILLGFFNQPLGRLLLGPDFRPYSWIFPWLFLSGGCFAASQQLLLKLTCELRTLPLAILWFTVAVIAAASYMISAHSWQLRGLVYSVVAVNILLLFFSLLISFQEKKFGDPDEE